MLKRHSPAVQFHVWETPFPTSLEDARDIVYELLWNEDIPLSDNLASFLAALWERFPSDADSVGEAPVWATRVKHRPQKHPAVLTVGISASHVAVAQPFLLKTAAQLGLVVSDSRFFVVFLPTGMELGDRKHLERAQDDQAI